MNRTAKQISRYFFLFICLMSLNIRFINAQDTTTGVQVFEDTLNINDEHYFAVDGVEGDILYVYMESLTGDLDPFIGIDDSATREPLISSDDLENDAPNAGFSYTFDETDTLFIYVTDCCGDTSGDYRLTVGLNTPEVLDLDIEPPADTGASFASPAEFTEIYEPQKIELGIELLQVTDIDQQQELFDIVAVMRASWLDERSAFDPFNDPCDCEQKIFQGPALEEFLSQESNFFWPEFFITNLQSPSETHIEVLVIEPDGTIFYEHRFNASLLALDFFFRDFPFDQQDIWIEIRSFGFDASNIIFTQFDVPEYDRIGIDFDEDEWIVQDQNTTIETVNNFSHYRFTVTIQRDVLFYLNRFLLPLFLIVLMGYAIFFIKENDTRVETSSGLLLIFIAFNFTIGDDLPRITYITFMDALLATCFIITTAVFMFSIYLKRLESTPQEEFIERYAKYVVYLYPLAYIIIIGAQAIIFLGE